MQADRWAASMEIFQAVLDRPPEQRAAFLERCCNGDTSLRKQVETLLWSHEHAGDFIATPAAASAPEFLADDPDALVGQHLGSYRIDAVLGVGGMGVVYRACDERLGRKVGLKLLPRALVNDETQLERLKLEARTASALNHPNIVTVHEIGQVESTHYIAIEFIEGMTLRERIARGPLPPDEALEIITQVASALCVAHKAGIVHRDIKPENIMIRPDGYVKVLDFGIAKSAQVEPARDGAAFVALNKTQRGVVLGTMRYMSPEQARGETVDARSDIWSIGIVLYEMLTGVPPFGGDTPSEVKDGLLRDEPQPLEELEETIPPALHRTIERSLRKDPRERFQSTEELLAALRAIAHDSHRRAWRRAILAAAAVVLLLAVAVVSSGRLHSPIPARDSETSGAKADPSGATKPTGLAVDVDGAIYVADFPNHTIRRITPEGEMTDIAGARGNAGSADGVGLLARFDNPADVAIGPDRSIYIADCNNNTIRKISRDGAVTTLAGQPGIAGHNDGPAQAATFRFPTGVAADASGNIYVADIGNHTVRKISADGFVSTLAGLAGEPGSADGTGAAARFNQPHGVAADAEGNVYVADFGNHTARKITPEGVVTTLVGQAGNPGSNDGVGTGARLCAPYSVAVDAGSNVYVADTSNHTIRKASPDGTVTTVAGVAGNVGSADGTAAVARFAIPARVEVDRAGNIYVADFGNYSIRKITSGGVVSTVLARAALPDESAAKSIAVLPFADLSPQRDQQYFSDGIAEEILNALAHVKDLKVTGRSSSFAFRGKETDVHSIGKALGVAHVLEGSVRKQGDKVRITAQLIQASDGFHLWSETYDGDMRDVFSLQERIARAITNQLQVMLQGEQRRTLVKAATRSSEAYPLYLQASAIFNRRDAARFPDAIEHLQEAVRLDSMFARAHARLASLASIAPGYDVALPESADEMVRREARLALELDPTLAEPHAAVGQLLFTQRHFSDARTAYARALEKDPDDISANFWLGTLLSSTGYAKASADALDKVLARDPMLPNALLWRGWTHLQMGEIDEAERSIRRAADAGLTSVGLAFAHVAQARNQPGALVDWLARGLQPFMRDLPDGTAAVIAAGTVGNATQRQQALDAVEAYLATRAPVISGAAPLALIWIGQPDRAFAIAQEKPTRNDTLFLPSLWTPAGRAARTVPQFAEFARRSGLADFWDASGPPDLCHRSSRADYECE